MRDSMLAHFPMARMVSTNPTFLKQAPTFDYTTGFSFGNAGVLFFSGPEMIRSPQRSVDGKKSLISFHQI